MKLPGSASASFVACLLWKGTQIVSIAPIALRTMYTAKTSAVKYVALLAFTKIVTSHPQLVSLHQDVIMECIDDPDISIRTRALELVVGMVDANNLIPIVERLLRQLREATPESFADNPNNGRGMHAGITPTGELDEEEAAESLRRNEKRSGQPPPLPEDYRISVIEKILDMCSRETYANINDFEWYIGVLVELVRHCPTRSQDSNEFTTPDSSRTKTGVADTIGRELVNVAVRVKSVRPEATAAAQSLVLVERRQDMFPASGSVTQSVLASAAWIAGEYADLLPDPSTVLTSLLHSSNTHLPSSVLSVYLQAIPKVFVRLTSNERQSWTPARKSTVTLLMARIIHFLEPLVMHPNLEVQERAVEYVELMRLASEAASAQDSETDESGFAEAPLLLTQAIPSLFTGMELNPVAQGALRKVPLTDNLDLETPINDDLQMLLQQADYDELAVTDEDETYQFYFSRPKTVIQSATAAADLLETPEAQPTASYQQSESRSLDPEAIARMKAERRERYRDDPFYIDSERNSGTSTPLHNILKSSNGEELDVDAIPIMDLQLDSHDTNTDRELAVQAANKSRKLSRKRVEIAADETIDGDDDINSQPKNAQPVLPAINRAKKSLLRVDSSGLSSLSLEGEGGNGTQLDVERRQAEEEEMARAMKEVERLRLEMQRAQERISAKDIPDEGVVVKRKKKKRAPVGDDKAAEKDEGREEGEEGKAKKKKKKKRREEGTVEETGEVADRSTEANVEEEVPIKKTKKKKKRTVNFDEPEAVGSP